MHSARGASACGHNSDRCRWRSRASVVAVAVVGGIGSSTHAGQWRSG